MKRTAYGCFPPLYVEWNQGPRDYQEDYFGVFSQNNRTLMVIADGMGGHSSGDLASRWTVEELVDGFKQSQDLEILINVSIEKILNKMKESGRDMGCTLVLAVIEKENDHYTIHYSWVGDSRLYLLGSADRPTDNAKKIEERNNRILWLLSDDDSFVWGFFLNDELTIDQLTEHPNKNQLEFSIHPKQDNIGEIIVKRIRSFPVHEGDTILMCTDGLWESYRFQSEILEHMTVKNPQKTISNHLKKSARDERFNDNATYIMAEINKETLKQECFPVKSRKKFIGQFVFGFLALCLFVMIFLVLISKHDGDEKNPNKATGIPANAQAKINKPGTVQPLEPLSGRFYSIHVGSFPSFEEAKTYAQKFIERGYQIAIISPEPEEKPKVYQVRIGRYQSLDEAKEVKQKLEREENIVFSLEKHQW